MSDCIDSCLANARFIILRPMFDSFLIAATGGVDPHPAMILPFAVLLLSIALMPFVHKHWWEHHYPKVAAGLGLITIVYYFVFLGNTSRMLHVAHEYVSFIALIGSLFVVSGGIHIRVKGESKPWINCLFLLTGAVLSNLIGTTGASILVHPNPRTDEQHRGAGGADEVREHRPGEEEETVYPRLGFSLHADMEDRKSVV